MTTRSVVCAAAESAPMAVPAASATAAAVIFQRLFMPVSLSDRGARPRARAGAPHRWACRCSAG